MSTVSFERINELDVFTVELKRNMIGSLVIGKQKEPGRVGGSWKPSLMVAWKLISSIQTEKLKGHVYTTVFPQALGLFVKLPPSDKRQTGNSENKIIQWARVINLRHQAQAPRQMILMLTQTHNVVNHPHANESDADIPEKIVYTAQQTVECRSYKISKLENSHFETSSS